MKRVSILAIAICLLIGVAGVSAQTVACLPGLSGADCTNYQAAMAALGNARQLQVDFEVLNRTSMGNISNTDIYVSGIANLSLAADGTIDSLLIQGDLTAELSGMMLNARQTGAFGFVLFEGQVYVGSGPYGTSLIDMTWEGFDPGPNYELRLGDTNPISQMAQYNAPWMRDDSERTPGIPDNIIFYTSTYETDSPMASAMSMLGGMAGGSGSDSVMGALMGGMFGAGMDSEMPGTAMTRGIVTVDTAAQQIAGLSTITAVGFDMSNMMGNDMLSGMVGTLSQQYNGVNLRFISYNEDFFNQAPPTFTPMAANQANAIRNLSGLGLQGMLAGNFLPQVVTGLLTGTNTADADDPDASDILDSMLGQTTTAASGTDMIAGMLGGMLGGDTSGSGSGSSDADMIAGLLGGMMGGSGSSSGDMGALMELFGGMGSSSSSGPAGATGGGVIEIGQTVNGTLANSRDEWAFTATAGQSITIDLQGSFDTYLEVYGPGGLQIASDDDGGSGLNSLISNLSLTQAGSYEIVVRAFGGNGTGTYTLALTSGGATSGTTGTTGSAGTTGTAIAAGGTIELGQTVNGQLNNSRDTWALTVPAEQMVSISLEGTFDTYLEVLDANGNLIDSDDDGGTGFNSLIDSLTFSQAGTYNIVARAFGGNGTGTYTLSVTPLGEAASGSGTLGGLTGGTASSGGNTIELGQTVNSRLSNNQESWEFTGEAGQVVSIAMEGTFDTYLEVFSPSGVELASDDDGGNGLNSLIEGLPLPQDGTYRIVARGFGGNASGIYSLTLIELDQAGQGGTIELGQTINASLAGTPQFWTFTANANTRVTIDMTANFDTYLELNGPNGALIASDDDGGSGLNSRIQITLPQAGTYTIVARGYIGSASGPYELSLSQ